MTQYKQYEIRRELLCFKPDEYARSLLVLLEHIDWSTGVKEATSFSHMKNWLNQLCSKYNLEWEHMKEAVEVGQQKGWLSLSADGKLLSLGKKPVPSLIEEVEPEEEVEQPGPVEPGEVPHYQRPGWKALTRERIRELTYCPRCGAEKGTLCLGEKKGQHTREANHKERSQMASRLAKQEFDNCNT